jgi:hypothetical protein
LSQALLGDVGDEVADVEGGVSLAAEVEVYEPEAIAIGEDLVGVEVAVDEGEGTLGRWGVGALRR